MDQTSPLASPTHHLALDLSQLGDAAEFGFGAGVDFRLSSQSPATSPQARALDLALSPIIPSDRNVSSHLDPSPGSTNPLSINIQPLHLSCSSCGSSVVTPLPSTVALYSLAVTMTPPTRSTRSRTAQKTTTDETTPLDPPLTTAKGRGKKRKTPTNVDDDDSGAAQVPVPAPGQPSTKGKATIKPSTARAMSSQPDNHPVDTGADPSAECEGPTDPVGPSLQPAAPSTATEAGPGGSSSSANARAVSEALSESALAARAAALEKEVRSLKKFKVMWAKQQQDSKNAGPSVSDESIPRPPGERGKNGWNMQTALQLEDDGDMYNLILSTTRDAVRQAGLDWRLKFDEQDPNRIGTCYSQMKHSHPYLKRFKNDWACRELVIGALQNRRKVHNAKVKAADKSPSKAPPKSKRNGFKPRSAKPKSKENQSEDNVEGDEDLDDNQEGEEGNQAE